MSHINQVSHAFCNIAQYFTYRETKSYISRSDFIGILIALRPTIFMRRVLVLYYYYVIVTVTRQPWTRVYCADRSDSEPYVKLQQSERARILGNLPLERAVISPFFLPVSLSFFSLRPSRSPSR